MVLAWVTILCIYLLSDKTLLGRTQTKGGATADERRGDHDSVRPSFLIQSYDSFYVF